MGTNSRETRKIMHYDDEVMTTVRKLRLENCMQYHLLVQEFGEKARMIQNQSDNEGTQSQSTEFIKTAEGMAKYLEPECNPESGNMLVTVAYDAKNQQLLTATLGRDTVQVAHMLLAAAIKDREFLDALLMTMTLIDKRAIHKKAPYEGQ